VFGNRVLRRIFIPTMAEIREGWKNLNNEEFHNLFSLPNIIIVIKLRMIR